jgi:hypothetical protein
MLSSNMLLPNLIPLIDVTFSTPTPDYVSHPIRRLRQKENGARIVRIPEGISE